MQRLNAFAAARIADVRCDCKKGSFTATPDTVIACALNIDTRKTEGNRAIGTACLTEGQ